MNPLVFIVVILVVVEWKGSVSTRCIERERQGLVRFKQGLTDDYGCLSSWGSEDSKKECCDWNGVYCSNTSGEVTYIYLYGCYIRGNISSDLVELTKLKYLDLSGNQFGGSIPDFIGSMTSLEDFRLMDNNFSGTIPHQLGNLTNLQILTLNYNHLVGKIPKSFMNLTNLQILFINVNFGLGEPLADFFGKLSCKALEKIDISLNNYVGPIPDLGACSELVVLKLHHNNLSGSIPESLGQLSKLGDIDASYNSLQGRVSETLFSKLHNLYLLDFSFNPLTFDFSPHWVPTFSLSRLTLGSCKMGPSFPRWLRTQTNITYIDISNAGIADQVPEWLWSFSRDITFFNISLNQISGTIPDLSSNFFGIIDVSSNNFSGALPLLHPNITVAHFGDNMFNGSVPFICQPGFTSQLEFLDLSDNQLAGELPRCWNNTRALKSLNLNNNHFDGEIPHALGYLVSLETLHLRGNNLSGLLPPTLRSCTSLVLLDVGRNKLTGEIPPFLVQQLTNMTHLSLRQNRFYGGIPREICHLTHIQMLDLSENELSGEIPPCFDNFTSLVDDKVGENSRPISFYIDYMRSYFDYVLVQWRGQDSEYKKALRLLKLIDLSSNRLTGNIPKELSGLKGLISLNLSRNSLTGRMDPSIGKMKMLEILDLSKNQLSGEIPISLAELHFLGVLDLANNNLSGKIPLGTQLQGFNASAYSGNNGLCGPPLPLCPNTSLTNQGEMANNKNGSGLSKIVQEFYPVVLGFVIGFWGVVASLVFITAWRNAYFGFMHAVADWLYVTATTFFAKFT